MERYLPTGSELLSLPRVNEKNGAVEDLGFLHMGSRGLIELRGGEAEPLMRPFVELDGAEAGLSDFEWERLGFWYPRFEARSGSAVSATGSGLRIRDLRRSSASACAAWPAQPGTASMWTNASRARFAAS